MRRHATGSLVTGGRLRGAGLTRITRGRHVADAETRTRQDATDAARQRRRRARAAADGAATEPPIADCASTHSRDSEGGERGQPRQRRQQRHGSSSNASCAAKAFERAGSGFETRDARCGGRTARVERPGARRSAAASAGCARRHSPACTCRSSRSTCGRHDMRDGRRRTELSRGSHRRARGRVSVNEPHPKQRAPIECLTEHRGAALHLL